MFIFRFISFIIAFLSLLSIFLIIRYKKKQKRFNKIEDESFLIFLLIRRLNEIVDEINKLLGEKDCKNLKSSVEKIKSDFFKI